MLLQDTLPQDPFRALRIRKGPGDRVKAPVVSEIVPVKQDIRSVRILEALLRFERGSQRVAADDPRPNRISRWFSIYFPE